MKKIFVIIVLFLSLILNPSVLFANGNSNPTDLRCEYLADPLGIDVSHPRLSWRLDDNRKGARQTAYRILVDTDSPALMNNRADMWDTGKVISDKTNNIVYKGDQLKSRQRYFCKVIVWDKDGKKMRSLKIASWETGLFNLHEWEGDWISDGKDINFEPAPYFRKEFKPKGKIKEARAYISGLGYYLFSINGRRVGTSRSDPAYTDYQETVMYNTYDITAYLNNKSNALGIVLGNGWYNEQSKAVWNFHEAPWRAHLAFLLNMYIEYENGENKLIISDTSWKTSTGPITFNNIYSGEYYDARLDLGAWNQVGYNDAAWEKAKPANPPGGKLKSQLMPSIRKTDEIKPVKIQKFNDTTYVFDMGQNFAGFSRLQITGEEGTKFILKHGEALKENGRVDLENISVHYRFEDSTPANTQAWLLLNVTDDQVVVESGKELNESTKFIEILESEEIEKNI